MEATKENKLGTMPVGKLLFTVSFPIVLSMLVQALYNVVDSIFVAQLPNGEDALAAVGLAFPIQNLMIAFAVGTSVGVASLLSRRLGEKDFGAANRAANNGLFLALITFVAFAIGGGLLSDVFFASYARNPEVGQEIADMGATYMRIVTVGSMGLFVAVMFERLLQATGRSVLSMVSQMSGAIVNIVLDPILIFGLLGAPALGVSGAALATVIGQWVGMLIGLVCNFAFNKDIKIHPRSFKPNPKTIKHIYQVGLPTIVMQSIGSVMTFGINLILAGFSSVAVSVFGVYFKLQSFIFMPVFGVNSGIVPIVAYNFGARKPDRIRQTMRLGVMAGFGIMTLGSIIFWVFPEALLLLFNAEADMLYIGIRALRGISLCFPMAAISIIFTAFFQALGEGMSSLILSAVRQLVFLLPLAWIFARVSGLDLVWYAFPVAELFALMLVIVLFRRAWKRKITLGLQAGAAEAAQAPAPL